MKALSLALVLSIFSLAARAQTTLFHTPQESLDLQKSLDPTLVQWTRFWSEKGFNFTIKKEKEPNHISIGGGESEMGSFLWLSRFEVCNYLTSDTLIKTEIIPLFMNNIPDSMILDVDHTKFEESAVERLAFLQDGLVLDSVWLTKFNYFQTWSSNTVNPYQANVSDLPDSLVIQLYDKEKEKGWSSPLDTAIVNSHFGFRRWRYHNGIDLDLEVGDLVRSAFGGVVRISSYNHRGFGHYIVIRHDNGLETLYGHLKEKFVRPGQYVEPGQLIGFGGNSGRSTGPHLHFEVRYQGFPIDPSEVFDFKKNAPKSDVFVWNTQKLKRTDHGSSRRAVQARKATRNSQGVRVYKVRSGDSLWVIARRHNTTVTRICQINGLTRTATLRIGQQLRLD